MSSAQLLRDGRQRNVEIEQLHGISTSISIVETMRDVLTYNTFKQKAICNNTNIWCREWWTLRKHTYIIS